MTCPRVPLSRSFGNFLCKCNGAFPRVVYNYTGNGGKRYIAPGRWSFPFPEIQCLRVLTRPGWTLVATACVRRFAGHSSSGTSTVRRPYGVSTRDCGSHLIGRTLFLCQIKALIYRDQVLFFFFLSCAGNAYCQRGDKRSSDTLAITRPRLYISPAPLHQA